MIRSVFLLICMGATSAAAASTVATHSIASLRETVNQSVRDHMSMIYGKEKAEADIKISVANLDSRLKLHACDEALLTEVKASANTQTMSVRVNCPSGKRWSIFVPVSVDIMAPVAFSTQNLRKGDRVALNDFVIRKASTKGYGHQYIDDVEDLIGKEVRRPVKAGTIIKAQDLTEPKLVKKGESVSIAFRSDVLVVVNTAGTALTDGKLGQAIRVRDPRSNRIVEAKVIGEGQAEVRIY